MIAMGPSKESFTASAMSPSFEHRRAALLEGALAMMKDNLNRALGLEREQRLEALAERAVEIVLHHGERERRAVREALREREGLGGELRVGDHAVREPEREALGGREPLAEEQDLASARGADEPRQEPARAVVARQAELHVRRGHERALGHHAKVAGERQREARAGG